MADHVIPRSVRPDLALDPSNYAAACNDCNRRKSSRLDYQPAPAPSRNGDDPAGCIDPVHQTKALSRRAAGFVDVGSAPTTVLNYQAR